MRQRKLGRRENGNLVSSFLEMPVQDQFDMQKEQVSEGGSGQAVVGSPPNANTANSEAAKKFLEKNENGGATTRKKKTREILISVLMQLVSSHY